MTVKSPINKKISAGRLVSYPYFEVRPKIRGVQVIVVGAIGVSEITSDMVLVKCHNMKLQIIGKSVDVNVLEHNTLEITGVVEDIKIINASI